jgi:hypothetical protein
MLAARTGALGLAVLLGVSALYGADSSLASLPTLRQGLMPIE